MIEFIHVVINIQISCGLQDHRKHNCIVCLIAFLLKFSLHMWAFQRNLKSQSSWKGSRTLEVCVSPANEGDARDVGSSVGWERSPGERNGNPLQYSCLENSVDRGAWRATLHWVAESDTTEWLCIEHTLYITFLGFLSLTTEFIPFHHITHFSIMLPPNLQQPPVYYLSLVSFRFHI